MVDEPRNLEPSPPGSPAPGASRRLGILVGVGIATALAAGIAFWLIARAGREESVPSAATPARSDDPRLLYKGPLLNIHPAVTYVGDAKCAGCHREIATAYHKHPMGCSITAVKQDAHLEKYGPGHHNPFSAFGAQFKVDRKDGRVWHRERWPDTGGKPVAELDMEIRYAIGSGVRGRSYLIEHDGYVLQSPISWFSQKQIWDKSPAFHAGLRTGRAVVAECLFCHANRVVPRAGYSNRYETPLFPQGHSIGCERCHGPGERHVASRGAEHTIVNPRNLEHGLREAVCQQCHLEGATRIVRPGRDIFDYRPGLPLEEYWSVFVHAAGRGNDQKAVNHVEQMYQSRCFQGSSGAGKLGCISCHDPHRTVEPAQRVAYYRNRCLECHKERTCSLPAEERLHKNQDSCIACHMPRYSASDIPHTAITDHTIVRRPAPPAQGKSEHVRGPLVSFFGKQGAAGDKDAARNYGIALVTLVKVGELPAPAASGQAVGLLERALLDFPDDPATWENKAFALWMQQRLAEALAAFQTALAKDPRREEALIGAASVSELLGQDELALGYWRKAVQHNPWSQDYRKHLVTLLAEKGPSAELTTHCRAWLRLDPGSLEARKIWVECLLHEGKHQEARAEFARLEALQPPNLDELRTWFKRQAP